MDTQPLDHSFHSADVPNLHTDLHTHQDLLNDPAIGVHHDPFDPSSIGTYEPNHVHSGFDSQYLADYQPHHANSLLDHQYSHVNHPSHLDHFSQRSGSETGSELLSKANGLEKQANESLSSSQNHSKKADWHREHKNQSDAASHGKEAQNAMAEFEKYQAQAQKLRDQAKKA